MKEGLLHVSHAFLFRALVAGARSVALAIAACTTLVTAAALAATAA